MSVKIKVISPEKIIWDTEAEEIVLPSITGGLGILTNHAPLVTVLQTGVLKKREQNNWLPIILWGGVAQIENNQIIVLANGVEELSKETMTLDEANKNVSNLLDQLSKETEPNKKLIFETEIAKARVEGLSLIN